MPDLTRRPDPHRANSWLIQYGDVHVGTIARAVGNPGAEPQWKWLCGFYPGSNPGEQRGGTADTFEQARAAFEAAWLNYLPRRTEADFQSWRDHQAQNPNHWREVTRPGWGARYRNLAWWQIFPRMIENLVGVLGYTEHQNRALHIATLRKRNSYFHGRGAALIG